MQTLAEPSTNRWRLMSSQADNPTWKKGALVKIRDVAIDDFDLKPHRMAGKLHTYHVQLAGPSSGTPTLRRNTNKRTRSCAKWHEMLFGSASLALLVCRDVLSKLSKHTGSKAGLAEGVWHSDLMCGGRRGLALQHIPPNNPRNCPVKCQS